MDVAAIASAVRADESGERTGGLVLLALGIVLSGIVLALIFVALYDPTTVPFAHRFERSLGTGGVLFSLSFPNGTVQFAGSHPFALLMTQSTIGLMTIAMAVIARSLIGNGVTLMRASAESAAAGNPPNEEKAASEA